MSASPEFETLLKEVVSAKRLSASKMAKLTEIALAGMENDTQLVSILYRTHKALPAASKISSLYVFDALARSARSHAVKSGIVGDIHAPVGNAATFLLKVEGVLDGLFQDLMSLALPEAQEKARKILDIWTKGSTFPQHVLVRLTDMTNKTKDSTIATAPVNIRISSIPPQNVVSPSASTGTPIAPLISTPSSTIPTTTPTADANIQNVLLALLNNPAVAAAVPQTLQAAPINGALQQTSANTDPLALIQQLAGQAKQLNTTFPAIQIQSQPIPLPLTTLNLPPPSSQIQSPVLYANDAAPSLGSYPPPHGHSPPRIPERFERRSRSPPLRGRWGPHRGGDRRDYPPRGRGGFRGRDNSRDRFRGPPRDAYRRRRSTSRSRSPSPSRSHTYSRSPPPPRGRLGGGGGGGRRDVRPYSPPRRPSNPNAGRLAGVAREEVSLPHGEGKDEFGRDLRPGSTTPERPTIIATSAARAAGDDTNEDDMDMETPPPQSAATAPASAPSGTSGTSPAKGGLDSFNFASFNFAEPESWKSLGRAWEATYGSPPSQEELMTLIMGMNGPGPSSGAAQSQPQPNRIQTYEPPQNKIQTYESETYDSPNVGSFRGGRGSWRGGGTFRGRGRGGYSSGLAGSGGYINGEWGYAADGGGSESDAIVLGGGGDSDQAWSGY